MTNKVPLFKKVELLIIGNSKDPRVPQIDNLVFYNCGLVITGDYIIVTVEEKDEQTDCLTSTGKIFNLNQITAYKTHAL